MSLGASVDPAATLRATLWMTGAIASFSLMAIGGRAVAQDLDTFELMFYRSLIGLALVVTFGALTGRLGQARTRRLGLHLVRNLFHFTAQNLWFYALAFIPLAQLFAIEFTTPIWIALLAPPLLGERMTAWRVGAAALGFVGILAIARPGLQPLNVGHLTAALSTIGFCGSIMMTKALSRTETTFGILFWLTATQALFGAIAVFADGDVTWPGPAYLPLGGPGRDLRADRPSVTDHGTDAGAGLGGGADGFCPPAGDRRRRLAGLFRAAGDRGGGRGRVDPGGQHAEPSGRDPAANKGVEMTTPLPRPDSDALVFDRTRGLDRLLEIMRRLRAPDGCPWDRAQSFRTIAPYTIEEACEVAEAIEHGTMGDLRDELGDLLLQVVYHAQMAEEAAAFGFEDVARAISDKMLRRHPHVFGTEPGGPRADPQSVDWEGLKAAERAETGEVRESVLDGVAVTLSGMTRAVALTKRAARVGFDWSDPRDVLAKLAEEAEELVAEIDQVDQERMEEEYGDLMFVLANLARHLRVDPEAALRRANAKFERRFRGIETALAGQGRAPTDATLDEMDALWDRIKAAERTHTDPHRGAPVHLAGNSSGVRGQSPRKKT